MIKKLAPLLLLTSSNVFANENLSYAWDFGTWFGGDKIATNPDGDNYNAGSGGAFDFGLSYKFSDAYALSFRNTVGYRYQGAKTGKGGNRGFILETSLVKEFGLFKVGAGFHGDFKNYAKDHSGLKTQLKDEIGPFVFVEYMAFDTWGFSVKYHALDYVSEAGRSFSGKQAGLFLTGTF